MKGERGRSILGVIGDFEGCRKVGAASRDRLEDFYLRTRMNERNGEIRITRFVIQSLFLLGSQRLTRHLVYQGRALDNKNESKFIVCRGALCCIFGVNIIQLDKRGFADAVLPRIQPAFGYAALAGSSVHNCFRRGSVLDDAFGPAHRSTR
mgnify:CR=1 FL=1